MGVSSIGIQKLISSAEEHKEEIIYYCMSRRLLRLSIPRLDFHVFFVGRYDIQYFSPVHSRLWTSGCSNISLSGIPLCFIETLLTFVHHLILHL